MKLCQLIQGEEDFIFNKTENSDVKLEIHEMFKTLAIALNVICLINIIPSHQSDVSPFLLKTYKLHTPCASISKFDRESWKDVRLQNEKMAIF